MERKCFQESNKDLEMRECTRWSDIQGIDGTLS
jgi:hypothetical protein